MNATRIIELILQVNWVIVIAKSDVHKGEKSTQNLLPNSDKDTYTVYIPPAVLAASLI